MSTLPPDKIGTDKSKNPFNIREYLKSANDASNRTRYTSIVLVIASILIFVGLNNEYMNSWMVEDLREAYKPGDGSMYGLLGHKPFGDYKSDSVYFRNQCTGPNIHEPVNISTGIADSKCDPPPADKAKKDYQEALMKIHAENRLFVRIPILGVAIHVNDLGLIGGITLIVLLLLLRTSLSREIKNLSYSFKKAYEAKQLEKFYDALAMRQLLTVPHMKGEKRNHFLSKTPYIVCLFPAFIYLWLVTYDIFTAYIIPRYRDAMIPHPFTSSILWLMIVEGICVVVICFTAIRCVERQHYVYSVWDNYWNLLKQEPELCLIEPDVADKLKNEEDYSVYKDQNDVEIAKLSSDLVSQLRSTNGHREHKQLGTLFLLRWFWKAIKEETIPIFHFLSHVSSFLSSEKHVAMKPLIITVDYELTSHFNNDKEINKKLREILKERDKKKQANDQQQAISEQPASERRAVTKGDERGRKSNSSNSTKRKIKLRKRKGK